MTLGLASWRKRGIVHAGGGRLAFLLLYAQVIGCGAEFALTEVGGRVTTDAPIEARLTASLSSDQGDGQVDPGSDDAVLDPADAQTDGAATDDVLTSGAVNDDGGEVVDIGVVRTDDTIVVPQFHAPWPEGETFRISQGNNGPFSHAGVFAWDIPMPVGTTVLAAASGIVVDLRDSTGGSDTITRESAEPENFVAVDHGDGLKSVYAHLDHEGVMVALGQTVTAGEIIGMSGNTGYSTSPHLHFEVRDVLNHSIPTGFVESTRDGGIAQADDEVTSRNVMDADTVEDVSRSAMPSDAFAVNSIELIDADFPGFLFEAEVDYEIRGRVMGDDRRVCAALVDPVSWATVFCELTPVAGDGSFVIPLNIPSDLTGPFWFGVISGNGGANGLAPARIRIVPNAILGE